MIDSPLAAEDVRRVRVAAGSLAVLLFLVTCAQVVNGLLEDDRWTMASGIFPLAGAAVLVRTLVMLRRGDVRKAVFAMSLVLLALTIPATKSQFAGQVVVCGPIIVVALALPYLAGTLLRVLAVAAAVVTTIDVAIAEVWPGPPIAAGAVPSWFLYIAFPSVFTAFILFLLTQFSARMRQLRRDEQASRVEVEDLSGLVSAVVQSSPVAIAVFDTHGTVRLWNPACASLFQLDQEAAVGAAAHELLQAEGSVEPQLARLRDGETIPMHELQVSARGATSVSLEVAAAPLIRRGVNTGYVVLATDVSARKALEAGLHQAQKMEVVGLLAGGIAHDFNNLLMIIFAEVSLLGRHPQPAQRDESVNSISEASQRAADLCRQLLTFSRRQLVYPRPHDLGALVAEVMPMLRRMLGKAITVHFVRPQRVHVASIDRSQFEQIVMNLLVNARDAMPDGGDIFITLEGVETRVVLTVRDTGPGMTQDVQRRVFEPFFTTKEPGRGTGLGLATVADIVRRAHGTIDVHSKVAEGSEFQISLPTCELEDEVASSAQHRGREGERRRKVLVVDDDAAVRRAVERILEANDWVVVSAANGAEAIDAISNHDDVALMVTDVIMPGLGGRELAERARLQRPGLAVLFVSGYSTDDQLAANVRAGRAHFLAKPFTQAEFELALTRLLAAPSIADATSSAADDREAALQASGEPV